MPKEGYIKKKGVTIPFGYETSEIKGYLKPIPKQQDLLLKYIDLVQTKTYSLREAAEQLSLEADRKISHVGLSKIIKKVTPSKPRSRFTVATQRKRKLAKEEKEIKKAKAKLAAKEKKVQKEKEIITKATESTDNSVVIEEELEQVAPSVKEVIKNSKVIFHPNEGPQTEFLAADEKDMQ